MKTIPGSILLGLICVLAAGNRISAQTCDVTWRKADNPRSVNNQTTIPAGQTVCAEPGVIVQFGASGELILQGNLIALGTAAEPVFFNGNGFPNRVRVVGTLDVRYGDVSAALEINPGGTILVRNSRFREQGSIHNVTQLLFTNESRFVSVQDSVFDSNAGFQSDEASIYVSRVSIVLRNVTFRNGGWASIGESNLYLNNLVGQNLKYAPLTLAQFLYQPQYLDTLNITNSQQECLSFQTGNYAIGPNTVLQGCLYPVRGSGGLLPGSNVPATGNQNNWVEGAILPEGIYAPLAVPYVMNGGRISRTEIYPGTTFKIKANATIDSFQAGLARVLGLPNAPVTFESSVAGQKWDGLALDQDGDKMEYIVFDGMQNGIYSNDFGGSNYDIDQSLFRNNNIAVNQPSFDVYYMEGNLFTNNAVGVNATRLSNGHILNGVTNPNLFENNAIAVRSQNDANPDVRNDWWNSPTGPTTPQNPGGTGDIIQGNALFQPFRTVRPDRADHPPVVRLTRRPFQITAGIYEGVFEAGQKIILTWDAFDNSQIVKQKIQFENLTNKKEAFVTVADNLPGTQRAYEFTMPNSGGKIFIRVVATDDKGQEGWDEWVVRGPLASETGALQITTPVAGQTFRGGAELQLNWQIASPFNSNQFDVYLILDGHRKALLVAGGGETGSFSTIKFPFVSTDSARFAVFNSNSRWFYSGPFSIRPDPRYPDAPPQVNLTAPQAGQAFAAGAVVPISWTASDDEAIRQFNILSSTDGGKTWITLVENLPPTATGYNWRTPLGTGFNDVRVRVVAVDRRFQNSSDGANRSFHLTPNQMAVPHTQFDFDGDGRADISVFRPSERIWYLLRSSAGFTASEFGSPGDKLAPADYDGDGRTDIAVFRNGTWYWLNSSNGSLSAVQFGIAGDVPVPGDYTGDGRAELAVYRAGVWWILNLANNQAQAVQYGLSSDKPVPADFDGDGRTDVAIYRDGAWSWLRSSDSNSQTVQFGIASDKPTVGDYDGDLKADPSVFRNGVWYILGSAQGFFAVQFGVATDIPVAADYDGDGKTDIAVYRDGAWYLQRSQQGFSAVQFGSPHDVPVPAALVP